jgi:hypothetical protein
MMASTMATIAPVATAPSVNRCRRADALRLAMMYFRLECGPNVEAISKWPLVTRLLGGGLAALIQRVLLPDLHGHFFRIKNAHAAKFYLVCKSWDPTNPGDTTPGGRFTIEELRSWLRIPEDEYRHTPHLKSAILDRAKAELDEAADGSFEYEPFRHDGVIAGLNRWSTTRSVGVRPNAASNRRCQPL